MKFFAVAALFAATALASQPPAFHHGGQPVSLEQAQAACGNGAKPSCCNSKRAELSKDQAGGGLLDLLTSGLAEGLGSYEGCSSLADLLAGGKSCQSLPTCCDGNSNDQHGSLLALNAANCVQLPLNNVLG
ncbi:hypothetical protein BDW42DRAFT_163729 [Aspergillus taichungensis]|uniref:Hydrophobin n=1 Tax=Aspergillus taichungensis TaxID=482145 RepID=A0A2J5I2A6_9EURO|nr:hypothetical protein BDW42DRAFT_163729 [Aspergillus taichungensis]